MSQDLSKTNSHSSSVEPPTSSSFFNRASTLMMGHRRPQAASESMSASHSLSETNSNMSAARSDLTPFQAVFPDPDPSVEIKKAEPLSEQEQIKYEQVLQHFQSVKEFPVNFKSNAPTEPLNEWETLRLLTRESMLRYLRATKWDVAHAKKRLTDTIIWRREFGVDGLDPSLLEPEAMTGKETILGFDNKGRPLHYMHPSRNTTQESPRQMQYAVWILERAIDLMPPGVEQLALLINFAGKKRNPTSISNAKLMLYILQNHYVERLGIALCINVPWIFKAFWGAIYPFIDPVTKSKCKFDEAIKTEVPASQLAADFGGQVDFTYDHDRYWPDLVKLSEQRRNEQLDRFRQLCNSEIGASEWVIRGGNDTEPLSPSSNVGQSSPSSTSINEPSSSTQPKPENAPTYHTVRENDQDDNDDDQDSTLDRFVTSQEFIPSNGSSEPTSRSDSENQTMVETVHHFSNTKLSDHPNRPTLQDVNHINHVETLSVIADSPRNVVEAN